MKVLIVSANFLSIKYLPMSPSGAAYIAGAAIKAGHDVNIFDCYVAGDLNKKLKEKLNQFNPDVVAISITIVTTDIVDKQTEFGTKYIDLRPEIKSIVNTIKQNTNAPIVLGGSGFNYFAKDWFDYLNLDYGIRGEGEYSFPLYLKRLKEEGDIYSIPGCIFKKDGQIHKVLRDWIKDLDNTGYPAYDLFDPDRYKNIPLAILTKRGCSFHCIYCPYTSLEGTHYRLKSPERIVNEIQHVMKINDSATIDFCDNSFNCPKKHAEAICKEIIDRGVKIRWSSGAIKPIGITKEFCRLLKASGCGYVGLSIETASEKMLLKMNRGFKMKDIREALDNLSNSDIPFGLSILIGAPGETPETISETFGIVDSYPLVKSMWVSVGLYLWTHHQKVLDIARHEGQLKNDRELFNGAYYISPELPKEYMKDFCESLKSRKNCNFQVNKPYSTYRKDVNIMEIGKAL